MNLDYNFCSVIRTFIIILLRISECAVKPEIIRIVKPKVI